LSEANFLGANQNGKIASEFCFRQLLRIIEHDYWVYIMPKRSALPWDKIDKLQAQLERAQAVLNRTIPSIQIENGIEYKSDRFYLHSVDNDEHEENVDESDTQGTKNSKGPCLASSFPRDMGAGCTCGAEKPPPLFDRIALVHSLDLQAAILGTYNLALEWMADAFPQLVGHTALVPTLILHGNKGLVEQSFTPKCRDDDIDECDNSDFDDAGSLHDYSDEPSASIAPDTVPCEQTSRNYMRLPEPLITLASDTFHAASESDERSSEDESVEGGASLATQEEDRSPSQWTHPISASTTPHHQAASSRREKVNTGATRKRQETIPTSSQSVLHLSRIMSDWTPPEDASSQRVTREASAYTKDHRRETKHGVHHPKYMILFERSGHVVIVVSTANLTPSITTEGSWVQRFHPHRGRRDELPMAKNSRRSAPLKNDFGRSLVDFLERSSQSARTGQMTVDQFLTKYMNFNLQSLEGRFHFEKAQVQLVPTIPGSFPVDHEDYFKYGRERVAHLLGGNMAQCQKFPFSSKKDRLIVQPTSFGGNWKRSEMADFVRSYLLLGSQLSGGDKCYWDDYEALGRLDIVWPSHSFVSQLFEQQCRRRQLSPTSVVLHTDSTMDQDTMAPAESTTPLSTQGMYASVFMSSSVFNSVEDACLSRMALFQPSDPPQRPCPMIPHFKSLARIVRGKQRRALKDSYGPADEFMSWFMLTSACLSLGAQGKSTTTKSLPTDAAGTIKSTIAYANFELGVLFTSQLKEAQPRGVKVEERLYCFRPHRCSCNPSQRGSPMSKMIHLPIPYCLRPKPYFENADDSDMVETPHFHEITAETRCVGNMLMTPYGKALANEWNDKRKTAKILENVDK
jgi:hypothetical protein